MSNTSDSKPKSCWRRSSQTTGSPAAVTTTVYADNIHCDSCAAHAREVLSALPYVLDIENSVVDRKVTVSHGAQLSTQQIVSALKHAAFEVSKVIPSDYNVDNGDDGQSSWVAESTTETAFTPTSTTALMIPHIDYCGACQIERNEKQRTSKTPTLRFSKSFDLEAQRDADLARGRDLSSDNGISSDSDQEYEAHISIGGMSCASCSNSITAAVKELDCVKEAAITVLTNSGVVTYNGPKGNVDKILETIEDVGFDASLTTVSLRLPQREGEKNEPEKRISERILHVKIDGMFCHDCPNAVLDAFATFPSDKLTVMEAPTLDHPVVTVKYQPEAPSLTVRTLLERIVARRPMFKPSVYHPPTVEDRSREMQARERRDLLMRLIFSIIVAIPTFLIMIVFGTLLPKTSYLHEYFATPIWRGTVTREEWALFITVTPVMFYGADVFHRRAFKEIKHLWRPGSPVPIMQRFYRFGSMNLLVSAGTLVAYISSLAILIIRATKSSGRAHMHSDSYFDTVAFLTMFILAGRSLEAYSKAKTGDAVAKLGNLRPSEALIVSEDESGTTRTETIPTDLLEIGDTVSIPFGASPPADGILKTTEPSPFSFDESSLTGESEPASKANGDKVYAGSVNVDKRAASVLITEIGGSSMLEQIVNVVREGQTKRAPVERFADVATSYFVPVITLIAIVTFIIWLALGESRTLPIDYLGSDKSEGGWAFWALKFAIAVFVVACPCGLALAAPTALFVGVGIAAKRGILVRGGGEAFQEATRLDAVIFDKTGTLTQGLMSVTRHDSLVKDGDAAADIEKASWTIAYALEEASTHPKARAIKSYCEDRRLKEAHITSCHIAEVPGQGMKGTFDISFSDQQRSIHVEAVLGSRSYALELSDANAASRRRLDSLMVEYEKQGIPTAVLSVRDLDSSTSTAFVPTTVFGFADPVRPEAADIITKLQNQGISVYMCTGDDAATAKRVAQTLNIPPAHVVANVNPISKVDFTRQIQEGKFAPSLNGSEGLASDPSAVSKRRSTAFVGDGTNDSGALATADISIAMSSGSDVALSAASFILLNSSLQSVLDLVLISKRVVRRVKYNFAWACVYNVCLVPVAAGVFYPIVSGKQTVDGVVMNKHWRLDPAWASLAMALSSVSVILNSLALRVEWLSFSPLRDMWKWCCRRGVRLD